MSAFSRHRRSGAVMATFTGFEADLLRSLASQVVELLHSERAAPVDESTDLFAALQTDFNGPTTAPEDPVLARLFPSAYPEDDEASADFRRFTEGALRDSKAAAAGLLVDTLEEAGLPPDPATNGLVIDVELDEDRAETWLRCFADIRLAMATRLGVEADDEAYWLSLPDDDPRAQAHDIYDWVGWLQESLLRVLMAT